MSGHSKWAKIKRQKGANDAARGKIFAKLSKEITLAAQEGGGNPEMNFVLRVAIDKAKAANFPSDNIDKAIKKGTGELDDGTRIVSVVYEAYGPGSVGLLIRVQSDNTNRAITEIRQIVENNFGGKMAPEGSVLWQFEQKGIIMLESMQFEESEKFGKEGHYNRVDGEEMTLEIMEVGGVEDIEELGEDEGVKTYEVLIEKDEYSNAVKKIQDLKYKIVDSVLGYKASQTVPLSDADSEKLDELIEALEESDEVDQVWHNGE